jgi:universal stress protein A
VPVDFSQPSIRALHTAARFAQQYGGCITLLHVFEPPRLSPLSTYLSMVKLEFLMGELQSKLSKLGRMHIDPEHLEITRVELGKPFEEIVAAARLFKTDLIIIATHGFTGVKRVLLGSTAERVIRYAPCPVLTVREDQRQGWLIGERPRL